jgi:hypothetical protein
LKSEAGFQPLSIFEKSTVLASIQQEGCAARDPIFRSAGVRQIEGRKDGIEAIRSAETAINESKVQEQGV